MPSVNEDRLIVSMVSDTLEEQPATQKRYLQCLNVDVGFESVPCVSSNAVGHEGGQQAIEVEEEKERKNPANEQFNQEHPVEVVCAAQGFAPETAALHREQEEATAK